MSRKALNPPPLQGSGVLNALQIAIFCRKLGGLMHANATLPPLPLAQRMTPTQRVLSIFFQPFFAIAFSNAF